MKAKPIFDSEHRDLAAVVWHYTNGGYLCRGTTREISLGRRVRCIYAHRIVFYRAHGYLPKQIDHINGVKEDNRIANLREATSSQNIANRGKQKGRYSSKFKGVSFYTRLGKWKATIGIANKLIHLGFFPTEEDAARVYDRAALKQFKEFARLNFPGSLT